MENPARLRHLQNPAQSQTEEQAARQHHSAATPPGLAFDSPEEVLRHDATQTPAPPAVAERLRDSLSEEPPPRAPWWRRLLGGS
jgi:hypothetical protein